MQKLGTLHSFLVRLPPNLFIPLMKRHVKEDAIDGIEVTEHLRWEKMTNGVPNFGRNVAGGHGAPWMS